LSGGQLAAEDNNLNSSRTRKLTAPAVLLLLSASLSAQTSQKPASHHTAKTHKVSHHGGKKSRKPRGQQAIDGERARQIQAALIHEHYMSGQPSGKWDDSTQQAMRRYQADQGWQSKSIPDSRALIRMGLGPDHVHLLNPESAMVSEPQVLGRTRAVTPVAAQRLVPARASSSVLPAQSSTPVTAPDATVPDISPGR
jgi:peptidoglycan hydrolase-like protein with peptidoglycan-binding domain